MKKDSSSKFPVVRCVVCDEPIKLPEYVTASKKYKGEVRCQECTSILHIKTSECNIEEYKTVTDKADQAKAMRTMSELLKAALAKEKDESASK